MLNRLWITLITAMLAGAPNIEYLEGVNTNDAGDGVILYSSAGDVDPDFDHINYSGTGAAAGDVVYTVIVYDGPAAEAEDNYILIVDCTEAGHVTIR